MMDIRETTQSKPTASRALGEGRCHYCAKTLIDAESGGGECNDCWEILSRVRDAVTSKPAALRSILNDCGIVVAKESAA